MMTLSTNLLLWHKSVRVGGARLDPRGHCATRTTHKNRSFIRRRNPFAEGDAVLVFQAVRQKIVTRISQFKTELESEFSWLKNYCIKLGLKE
jgi:hypothetical protein